MTYAGPLYSVPYAVLIILGGLLGLALLVTGALLLGLSSQRKAGRLFLLGGALLLAGAAAGSLVATWLATPS